jgi:HAMP domain-containing protein
MRRKYYNSLRFKITVGLLLSLIVVLAITSYLRYVSFRRLLVESLELSAVNTGEIVEAQLAAYLRSRLILSASSIAVTVLIAELMMSKLVISRLRQLWATVKRVGSGDLNARVAVGGRDEITELAAAFNIMTADLQRQDEKLSALYLLATTVSQSLDLSYAASWTRCWS